MRIPNAAEKPWKIHVNYKVFLEMKVVPLRESMLQFGKYARKKHKIKYLLILSNMNKFNYFKYWFELFAVCRPKRAKNADFRANYKCGIGLLDGFFLRTSCFFQ